MVGKEWVEVAVGMLRHRYLFRSHPTDPFRSYPMTLSKTGYQGISIPELRIGLDTAMPVEGLTVVSHAHSDHMPKNRNMQVVCTAPTAAFLRERGFRGGLAELDFLRPMETDMARITLYPAGHILGSAMVHIESDQGSLLYTGDCRNPPSPVTEGFSHPETVDILVTEATFGLPLYKWASHQELSERIRRFATDALSDGEVPMYLAYTLGKTQEVLHALAPLGITTAVHPTAYPLCQIYEAYGMELGTYERYDADTISGKAVIMPQGSPAPRGSRPAYVSGWAVLESRHARVPAGSLIPLSDHIDYFELLAWIGRMRPGRVLVTHTPDAAVMEHSVRALGIPCGRI